MSISKRATLLPLGAVLFVTACGGGGGGGGGVATTPAPPPAPPAPTLPNPTPPPAPTTPPPPPPVSNANVYTREYRDSVGPDYHGADAAYLAGITGDGVIAALIDTGIDGTSHEFTGRIHASSADLAGSRGLTDQDGHGTAVARTLAAAKDNRDILGMAYGATILALKTDVPGSCTGSDTADGCIFSTAAIAQGVDVAVAANARVINFSLGGEGGNSGIVTAVRRAVNAGIVVVVAAGNEFGDAGAGYDTNSPTPFALELLSAGQGNVIIVGSIDDNGSVSSFSNRAGSARNNVLMARGRGICCVYAEDEIGVDANGNVLGYVGTSFATPQVSGAVALLAEAFPNLTGPEIVELLLSTARDAGSAGTDATYGRGILDVEAALAPQGQLTPAGTTTTLQQREALATLSSAMGDAGSLGTAGNGAAAMAVLDRYRRAYSIDIADGMLANDRRGLLAAPLLGRQDQAVQELDGRSLGLERLDIAMSLATPVMPHFVDARPEASRTTARNRFRSTRLAATTSGGTQLAFAFNESADSLSDRMAGRSDGGFLIAEAADFRRGIGATPDMALAVGRKIGPFAATLQAEGGEISRLRNDFATTPLRDRQWKDSGYRSVGIDLARTWGADWKFGATLLDEDESIMGARFAQSIGRGGATSLFLRGSAGFGFAHHWRAEAGALQGWTRPDAVGLIAGGGQLVSRGWHVELTRDRAFSPNDRLSMRVSQPLRIEGGGLSLDLPVSYDYASESASFARRTLSLSPSGRELASEIGYAMPIARSAGWLQTNLFWRQEPGHIADAADDVGFALRVNFGF